MKVFYEEADIVAGRALQKPDCGVSGRLIIGYQIVVNGTFYGIVAVADGMFSMIGNGTKQEVADWLNHPDHGYLPIEICHK